MTTQEKLKIVEERIKKDIPRLMEPTEGCLVIHRNTLIKILYEDGNHYKAVTVEWDEPKYWILDKDAEYTIIGHEIMLNDVLEWANKYKGSCKSGEYYIELNSSGHFIHKYISDFTDRYGGISILFTCKINLSEFRLKDQPEELINFLYELTK